MKKMFLPVIVAVLSVGAGCQDTVNTVENSDKSSIPVSVADKRVITDGFLKGRLAVNSVNVADTAMGFLNVQVSVTNMRTGFFSEMWSGMSGGNPYRINYRFRWFDENGMAVIGVTAVWQQVIIQPGETAYISSVAPTRDCRDFLLDLQEAE